MLNRVSAVFFNLNASNTDAQMQEIDSRSPQAAGSRGRNLPRPALFARVDAFTSAGQPATGWGVAAIARALSHRVRPCGARLSDTDKARLREINGRLSSLTTRFKQNVLKTTKSGAVIVDSAEELDGLSAEQVGAAAALQKRGVCQVSG